MRAGPQGELIFTSTAEARIASELLIKASGNDVLAAVGLEPPLQQPRIGIIDAINRRIEDHLGTSRPQEHVIANTAAVPTMVKFLAVASMPKNIIFPPRYTRPFRRTSYMAKRVRQYYAEQRTAEYN